MTMTELLPLILLGGGAFLLIGVQYTSQEWAL